MLLSLGLMSRCCNAGNPIDRGGYWKNMQHLLQRGLVPDSFEADTNTKLEVKRVLFRFSLMHGRRDMLHMAAQKA